MTENRIDGGPITDGGPVKFSTPCGELFAALATAQAAIETPKKTKSVKAGAYSYSYADLASIREACREPLKAAGLAVVQSATTDDDGRVVMTTLITHSSGQWMIIGPLKATPDKATPQGVGSSITYLKRYAISAALNIATEDDDGASAEKGTKGKSAPQRRPAQLSDPNNAASEHGEIPLKAYTITPAQQKELWKQATDRAESLDKTSETLMRDLLAHMQVDATAAIPASEYPAAVEAIAKWDPEVEFGA